MDVFNYIKYDIVVEEVIKGKIDLVSAGLITTVQNQLDFNTIVKYFKDLDYLSMTDISELKKKSLDDRYILPKISQERLFSRGLLKDNLLEKATDALRSLKDSIVNSLMDGAREDIISVDYPKVSFTVSEWGKKFIEFYNI